LRPGQNLDGGSLVEAAIDDLKVYEAKSASTNTVNISGIDKKLVKITDILGRELDINSINQLSQKTIIYIYNDGSVKKIMRH